MIQNQVTQSTPTQPNLELLRPRHPYLLSRNRSLRPGCARGNGTAMAASMTLAKLPLLQAVGDLVRQPSTRGATTTNDCFTQLKQPELSEENQSPICPQRAATGMLLPAQTSGIEKICGTSALLVIDAENIVYGLRKAGLKLDFETFRQRLASMVGQIESHMYSTAHENSMQRQSDYFHHAGFVPHIDPIRTVQTYHGTQVKANSDGQLLLGIAERVTVLQPNVLIFATGDGDLGCAVAQFLASRSPNPPKFHVASVRYWTSKRLYASNNPAVAGNVWLGRDLMQPLAEHPERT